MSVSTDIRQALEKHLVTVAGLPATQEFEGAPILNPTPGTAYVSAAIHPVAERPSSAGSDAFILHEGLFLVNLFLPSGKGPHDIEVLADAVKAAFTVATVLTQGSTSVRIRYAEKSAARVEADWLMVPITISWYVYSQSP